MVSPWEILLRSTWHPKFDSNSISLHRHVKSRYYLENSEYKLNFLANTYAMSDGDRSAIGQLKKFVFRGKATSNGDTRGDYLEIVIPELRTGGYSFYTWASAPLLAWYLWSQRRALRGLRVLELGCGTALPGILAAKCGARVTLTDSVALPRSLRHLAACCEANGLAPARDVRILGLAWGLFLADVHDLRPVDLVLASDCFYEPSQFEEVLATVAYLLDGTDGRFLCSYQERSADWSVEAALKKWGLRGAVVDLDSLSASSGVDYRALSGDKSLHLLEIVAA